MKRSVQKRNRSDKIVSTNLNANQDAVLLTSVLTVEFAEVPLLETPAIQATIANFSTAVIMMASA